MKYIDFDKESFDNYLENLQKKVKLLIKLVELTKLLDEEYSDNFSSNKK